MHTCARRLVRHSCFGAAVCAAVADTTDTGGINPPSLSLPPGATFEQSGSVSTQHQQSCKRPCSTRRKFAICDFPCNPASPAFNFLKRTSDSSVQLKSYPGKPLDSTLVQFPLDDTRVLSPNDRRLSCICVTTRTCCPPRRAAAPDCALPITLPARKLSATPTPQPRAGLPSVARAKPARD